MPKTDTRKYAPNTPPPAGGYPLMGKTSLVMADLLARAFGLEKPVMEMELVSVKEL